MNLLSALYFAAGSSLRDTTPDTKKLIHVPQVDDPPLDMMNHAPSCRLRVPIVVTRVLLAVVIAVEGCFSTRLPAGTNERPIPGRDKSATTQVGSVNGSFVQPPLNPTQINAIRHMVIYMQDKQLASLYVSGMTLDEELGQLIMVEYAEDHYASQLETMITQLHAGGVIMYEFQMTSVKYLILWFSRISRAQQGNPRRS